jgi:hypothetical protein
MTFVVSREWRDANGAPRKDDYRPTFCAAAADTPPIDPVAFEVRQ